MDRLHQRADLACRAAWHVGMVFRLTHQLVLHLTNGTWTWLVMALRLVMFVLLLLPGFSKMLRYWMFDPDVHKNIDYGQGSKQRHLLDVYVKPSVKALSSKGRPVIVFFSGGAWIIGYKAWGALMARIFAEKGFVFICVDHRNFPQATIVDMIGDARTAVGWVLSNVSEYGGDPNKIIVAGQSTGAHILSCLLMDQLERELGGESLHWKLAQIKLFLGISGPYNLVQLEKHLDTRGLNSRMLRSIMHNDLERYSPALSASSVGLKRLFKSKETIDPSGELFHPHPLVCKLDDGQIMDRVQSVPPAVDLNTRISVSSPEKTLKPASDVLADSNSTLMSEHISFGGYLPPMVLFHGEADATIPSSMTQEFGEQISLAGGDVSVRVYKGWTHTDPIVEGPMAGDDSLCKDMMLEIFRVLQSSRAINTRIHKLESEPKEGGVQDIQVPSEPTPDSNLTPDPSKNESVWETRGLAKLFGRKRPSLEKPKLEIQSKAEVSNQKKQSARWSINPIPLVSGKTQKTLTTQDSTGAVLDTPQGMKEVTSNEVDASKLLLSSAADKTEVSSGVHVQTKASTPLDDIPAAGTQIESGAQPEETPRWELSQGEMDEIDLVRSEVQNLQSAPMCRRLLIDLARWINPF